MKIKYWRIIDLINWGNKNLSKNKIENSKREIEWFLCNILNCNYHVVVWH